MKTKTVLLTLLLLSSLSIAKAQANYVEHLKDIKLEWSNIDPNYNYICPTNIVVSTNYQGTVQLGTNYYTIKDLQNLEFFNSLVNTNQPDFKMPNPWEVNPVLLHNIIWVYDIDKHRSAIQFNYNF